MRITSAIFIINFLIAALNTNAQENPEDKGLRSINEDVLKAQLGFLASDWTEGRFAGEKGERIAGDYIASMLQLYGVKPFGDKIRAGRNDNRPAETARTYFQNFVLIKTLPGEEQIMQVRSTEGKTLRITTLSKDVDFTIRPADPAFEITAPVIFVGYGYRNDGLRYNDFSKLDLKGKFILRIQGIPKFAGDKMNAYEVFRSTLRMDSIAEAMGAVGIIEFNPDRKVAGMPEREEFMNMSPSEGNPRSGKPRATYSIPGENFNYNIKRVSVSVKTANEVLKGSGINVDDYIKKADQNQPFQFNQQNNCEIYLKTSVITTQVAVRNILGIIEGKSPDQIMVLGAHYDHMGIGNGYIWNGADDNASGTVGIMTLAKAIVETGVKPEKSIVIALWTAEEEGLLGSRYFLDNQSIPIKNIKMNLNFDMISRYISDSEPKKVTMTYSDNYPVFKDITVSNLKKYNIDLETDYQPSADPPGGSDHRSFVAKGIPIMRFKPGHREEYHKPGDEFSTLNWDIMEKIVRISFLNIWQLANSDW